MWALAGPAIVLVPLSARASATDLTPCSGAWEGTAEDPWEPGPYTVQLALTGGAEQCATVTYVGLCTSRWVDCTVRDGWVTAREVLVDPGNCAPGVIQVRCPNADTLDVRWEGEPGVMEATLHRAARQPSASPIRPTNQAPTKPDAPASPPTAERPKSSSSSVPGFAPPTSTSPRSSTDSTVTRRSRCRSDGPAPTRSACWTSDAHGCGIVRQSWPAIEVLDDGWTAITTDGSPSAQFEHTIAITDGAPEILTLLPPP